MVKGGGGWRVGEGGVWWREWGRGAQNARNVNATATKRKKSQTMTQKKSSNEEMTMRQRQHATSLIAISAASLC